ncbi:MAG TPA: hypothetical protein GX707_11565 [Epulopiscium sp.]|nr:hypothetical protein [Candidatus Epulonipiscium sp.]
MSKFDYENFSDGWDTEFVVHAKKFSKTETLDLFIVENAHLFSEGYRKPTIDDIAERTVRWYPRIPEWCGYGDGSEGGCYSYCKREERGSFPAWVIEFERIEVE